MHQKNIASNTAQELIEELIEDFGRKQRRSPAVGFGGLADLGRKRCKYVVCDAGSSKATAGGPKWNVCSKITVRVSPAKFNLRSSSSKADLTNHQTQQASLSNARMPVLQDGSENYIRAY